MQHYNSDTHVRSKGFFLIEVIVASSIIAVVLILLIGSIQNTVEVSKRALERTQASFLLEEGAEATKAIRDAGWGTITALTPQTPYYLTFSGTAWSLTATPGTIDRFTRTITVSPVSRDSNDDIVQIGTLDGSTLLVTVAVAWSTPSGVQSKTLPFYIANIRE